jgi:hypothetical protein
MLRGYLGCPEMAAAISGFAACGTRGALGAPVGYAPASRATSSAVTTTPMVARSALSAGEFA